MKTVYRVFNLIDRAVQYLDSVAENSNAFAQVACHGPLVKDFQMLEKGCVVF